MTTNGSSERVAPAVCKDPGRKRNLGEEKRIIQMLQQIHKGEGMGLTLDELDRVDLMLHRMTRAKHHIKCSRPCRKCGLFWCSRCEAYKEQDEFAYERAFCKDCKRKALD